ncbi:MAG: hypothetical protein CMH52_12650 [Myxococcales bacterium]|nr:hypothetical protein [Myxococcales bacterium]
MTPLEKLKMGHIIGIMTLVVGVIYGHTIQAQFVWDDVFLIERNQSLSNFQSAWSLAWGDFFGQGHSTQSGYLRPIPTMLNYLTIALFGYSTAAFHAIQLSLHLLVLTLAAILLRQWRLSNLSILIALGVYTCHPMQVEALSFVSCRPELLAAVFVLSTCLCVQKSQSSPSKWWTLLGGLSLTFGFFSKETAVVVLPFLWLTSHGRPKSILWVLTAWTLGLLVFRFSWSPIQGGDDSGLALNLSLAFNLVAFYVKQLFLVEGPRCLYTYLDVYTWRFETSVTCVLLCLFGVWIALLRPRSMLAIGLLWFLLFIGPVLHLIPFGTLAADRYLYLPLLGVVAAIAGCVDVLIKRQSRYRLLAATVSFLVLLAFSALSKVRSQEWRDEITLWSAEVEMAPIQAHALVELGTAMADQNRIADAHKAYRLAWRLKPGGQILFRNLVRIESQKLSRDLGRALRNAVLDPTVTPETLQLWSERLKTLDHSNLSNLIDDQLKRRQR